MDSDPIKKGEILARSVYYLVTGRAIDSSWPSVRELVVRRRYGALAGHLSLTEATTLLQGESGPIFGPLTEEHRQAFLEELTGNNSEEDLWVLLNT